MSPPLPLISDRDVIKQQFWKGCKEISPQANLNKFEWKKMKFARKVCVVEEEVTQKSIDGEDSWFKI